MQAAVVAVHEAEVAAERADIELLQVLELLKQDILLQLVQAVRDNLIQMTLLVFLGLILSLAPLHQ